MSDDTPRVAQPALRNTDGTLTIPTTDAGAFRFLCPSWCKSEHGYLHPPAKAEITHRSEPIWALADTPEYGPTGLIEVSLVQWPYSSQPQVSLSIETDDGHQEFGPTGGHRIAAALRTHADHIDGIVEQLIGIRAGAK